MNNWIKKLICYIKGHSWDSYIYKHKFDSEKDYAKYICSRCREGENDKWVVKSSSDIDE